MLATGFPLSPLVCLNSLLEVQVLLLGHFIFCMNTIHYRSQPRHNHVTCDLRLPDPCGYMVRDEWLFQRGVELGYPRPVTIEDQMDILSLALTDHMTGTGV